MSRKIRHYIETKLAKGVNRSINRVAVKDKSIVRLNVNENIVKPVGQQKIEKNMEEQSESADLDKNGAKKSNAR